MGNCQGRMEKCLILMNFFYFNILVRVLALVSRA